VLSALSWPEDAIENFLDDYRRGNPQLPEVELIAPDLSDACEALEALAKKADPADPLERFVADTAESYATAARMIRERKTPGFTARSAQLYGEPRDRLPGSALTHVDAARLLLDHTDDLTAAGMLATEDLCLTAEHVAEIMRERLRALFGDEAPAVVVDDSLAAKAAAGASRIRIRGRTCFSEADVNQLIEHEGFVHSLTALNGRRQPLLSCMGLGSPRTTATQEGIATLAELATRAIDIARLRRIALRIMATDAALEGASFIEVFELFLEAGQSESESAHSAMRVFRGGDVRGRIAFTKDVVYLAGLIGVHTFLRKAIGESRPHLVRRLFSGRMALPDVQRLDQAFATRDVIEPAFVPPWARDLQRLAAYLAFTSVVNQIDLGQVTLDGLLAGDD
jgi:uncharacterized protein (TIGR02421 family)